MHSLTVRALAALLTVATPTIAAAKEESPAAKSCEQLAKDIKDLDRMGACGRLSVSWFSIGSDEDRQKRFERSKLVAKATELAVQTAEAWAAKCKPAARLKRTYAACFSAKAALAKRTKTELPSYFHARSVPSVRTEAIQRVRNGKPARGGTAGRALDAYIQFAIMFATDYTWLGFDLGKHKALEKEVQAIYDNAKADSDKVLASVRCPKPTNRSLSNKLQKPAREYVASMNKTLKTRKRALRRFSVIGNKRQERKLRVLLEFVPVASCNKVTMNDSGAIYCEVVKGTWRRQKSDGGRWSRWSHYSVRGATRMDCKNLK